MSTFARTERSPLVVRARSRARGPTDPAEREAEALADRVVRMRPSAGAGAVCPACADRADLARRSTDEPTEDSASQGLRMTPPTVGGVRVPPGVEAAIRARQRGGSPLPGGARQFFEPRLAADLSSVRIHADAAAADLADRVQARAFTVDRDVFFARGTYSPGTDSGRRLLAHELAHTLQSSGSGIDRAVHRAVELRPPGRGEASAYDRRQELVDRLNATSAAVTYNLDVDDRTLLYTIDDAGAMDAFDRMMTGFIDAGQVIPLRLITSAGRVRNAAGTFVPATVDSFVSGYVDLDDLLGSNDTGFKLLLAHFITERLQVPNYARRIGTAGLVPLFERAHARGRDAEAELLQDVLGDPSIRHHFDELKPDGTTFVRSFRSGDHGYRVFYVLRGHGRRAVISITELQVRDGTRTISLEDFIAERAAVGP
jgi:hypothetical protein